MTNQTGEQETVKEKLAKIVEQLAGPGSRCDPEWLKVNRGSNRLNDWCSWTGRLEGHSVYNICSWDTMTSIVKSGAAVWIDAQTGEIAAK